MVVLQPTIVVCILSPITNFMIFSDIMKQEISIWRYLVTLLVLMAALTLSASAHSLWVETKDTAEVGDEQQIYVFYGHANSPNDFSLPLLNESFLIKPDGTKMELKLAPETDKWIPGYGGVKYFVGNVVLDEPGDYTYVVEKAPAVFDQHWLNPKAESMPFYFGQWAKAVIHCGEGEAEQNWTAGVPLEIIPDQAAYNITSGENFTGTITLNGKPVSAMYYAYYWTWDVPHVDITDPEECHGYHWKAGGPALSGFTEDDGKLTVNLNKSGQWIICAMYESKESGQWTAKSDEDFVLFYKAGEVVPYDFAHFGSANTVWVK